MVKLEKNITKEEGIEDYKKLKDLDVKKYYSSLAGNKALDYYFFNYRIKTKVGKWSHYSAWNDNDERKKIIKNWSKLHKDEKEMTNSSLYATLQMMYGSVNQFRPSIAKYIYNKFKPITVLDFSSGWGGRLLGAMSLDINYIGIDSNKKLAVPYKKVIDNYESKSKVKLIFKKSENVDYSKLKYDMVFTSPPYEMLEKYEGMENYEDNKFYTEFIYPVIEKSFLHLDKGGVFILNIPNDMYSNIKKNTSIGSSDNKIPLIKNQRSGSGNKYKEYMYIWKK